MSNYTMATIILSVTLSALGQVCFKLGLNSLGAHRIGPTDSLSSLPAALMTPWVIVGFGLYGVGTLLWLSGLGSTELSQIYPFVGLGFVLTTLAGWWLFHDALSFERLFGIALIVLGIAVVART